MSENISNELSKWMAAQQAQKVTDLDNIKDQLREMRK